MICFLSDHQQTLSELTFEFWAASVDWLKLRTTSLPKNENIGSQDGADAQRKINYIYLQVV